MHDDIVSTSSSRSWRLAMAIGVAYGAVGLAWVLWSDALVQALSDDPDWRSSAQSIKGAVYVALTSLGLIGLVHWANERVLKAAWLTRRTLRRQETRFRQLLESLGDVVWLAEERSQRLLYVSPAFEDLYGRSAAELEHNPRLWLDAVLEEDRGLAAASLAELERLGGSSTEYRIVRPDGTIRWLSDRKRLIRDDDGEVRVVGGVVEDITALKTLGAMTARPGLGALLDERHAESQRQRGPA